MKRYYPLWQRILGPRFSKDDMLDLEIRAAGEGWFDWLIYEITTAQNSRRLKWLLAGLRDGYITVTVLEDPYSDPDPFEMD